MASTTNNNNRFYTEAERQSLASSHLRKRRRVNALRGAPAGINAAAANAIGIGAAGVSAAVGIVGDIGAPAANTSAAAPRLTTGAPRHASARPTSVEVRCLDAVLLHDPDGQYRYGKVPQVLHIDADIKAATVLAALLMPEARVTHAANLAQARNLLSANIYSLVVLDPQLPDGDIAELLPALALTPLLVYAPRLPDWRAKVANFLPKPWTTPRQLWSTISAMLGIVNCSTAGD